MKYTEYITEHCRKHITISHQQSIIFDKGKESYTDDWIPFESIHYYDYNTENKFSLYSELIVHAKKQV